MGNGFDLGLKIRSEVEMLEGWGSGLYRSGSMLPVTGPGL